MTSNVRKVVFFILLAGVACCAYQYMIKPANKAVDEKKAEVEKKMVKLAEFEKATSATKDLSKQLAQLEEAIKFFENRLPPKSEIHRALEQITVIAQKEGLKPQTIRALNRKDNSRYVEQPLKMELTGDFGAFYSFLLEMEKLPRIMKIRELEMKKATDEGQITANFVVSIFFQST